MTSQRSLTASRAIAVACAATLFALGSAAVTAGSAREPHTSAAMSDIPSLTVSYSDLNLATEQGNLVLLRRIEKAAVKLCPATSASGPWVPSSIQDCRDDAVARAVSDTKSALLAELHAARGHRVAST